MTCDIILLPCALPLYAESCGGPEVISCFRESQFVNNFVLPLSSSIFNFLFLSSETKSLSLSVTAKIQKGVHHFKEVAGWLSVLFNFSLIRRRDDMRVQACGCTLVLIPRGIIASLYRLSTGLLHSVSLGQRRHYARQQHSRGALLKPFPVCACVQTQ